MIPRMNRMHLRSYRLAGAVALGLMATALTSCGYAEQEAGTPGLGDRCADFMQRSFPGSGVTIKAKHEQLARTAGGGLTVMIVTVSGVRKDTPESGGFVARNVAAECRFENAILTEFKWTQGPFR